MFTFASMTPRIIDPEQIEQRLLELAYTSDVKITVHALAYYAPCSLAAAQDVLDRLTTEDRLQMEVEDDGTIVYHVPARTKLPPLQPQPVTRAPDVGTDIERGRALVPAVDRSLAPARQANPALAAVLAALFPGAGHLYAGRIGAALLWFVAITAGYLLIVPGLILQLASMVSAARATLLPSPYHATTWN
jgi:hypothetical protein